MRRICLAVAPVLWLLGASLAVAEESPRIETTGEGETYLLKYALEQDTRLHYEVVHVAKTKTRINGAEEISNVHTKSRRHWHITETTPETMTFDHVVDSVEMTQQQGEAEEIRWDSNSGEPAPKIFTRVAEQIGQTLSTLTINPHGQEKNREDHGGTKASLGMGSLTLAFPSEPLAIGGSWSVPREVKARTESGEVKTIKIRELYTLEKVKTGVATLSLRSEPLTPIDEETVRAQVVQQLSNGEIRFDIDNGHMISKQLDWDETVVGFQGANSMMEYRARLTETLIDGVERTARR